MLRLGRGRRFRREMSRPLLGRRRAAGVCALVGACSILLMAGGSRGLQAQRSKHVAPKLFRGFRLFLHLACRAIFELLDVAYIFDASGGEAVESLDLVCIAILIELRHHLIRGPLGWVPRAGCFEVSRGFEELLCDLGDR